jgi:hypothetical protein
LDKPEEIEKVLNKVKDEDAETVQEFCHCSANDTVEAVCFLEGLFSKGWAPSTDSMILQRALIVALELRARVKAIQQEFQEVDRSNCVGEICDNGYTDMETNNLESRVRGLVAAVCNALKAEGDNGKLKKSILSMGLLRAVLARSLECKPEALTTMREREFVDRILKL